MRKYRTNKTYRNRYYALKKQRIAAYRIYRKAWYVYYRYRFRGGKKVVRKGGEKRVVRKRWSAKRQSLYKRYMGLYRRWILIRSKYYKAWRYARRHRNNKSLMRKAIAYRKQMYAAYRVYRKQWLVYYRLYFRRGRKVIRRGRVIRRRKVIRRKGNYKRSWFIRRKALYRKYISLYKRYISIRNRSYKAYRLMRKYRTNKTYRNRYYSLKKQRIAAYRIYRKAWYVYYRYRFRGGKKLLEKVAKKELSEKDGQPKDKVSIKDIWVFTEDGSLSEANTTKLGDML